jgi:hypothetical protein
MPYAVTQGAVMEDWPPLSCASIDYASVVLIQDINPIKSCRRYPKLQSGVWVPRCARVKINANLILIPIASRAGVGGAASQEVCRGFVSLFG